MRLLVALIALISFELMASCERSTQPLSSDHGTNAVDVATTKDSEISFPIKPLRERIIESMREYIVVNTANANWPIANNEAIATLKKATPQSLKKPQLVACMWNRLERRKDMLVVFVRWIEDRPTLRKVIVANPINGKEVKVAISDKELAYSRKLVPILVSYSCDVLVPASLVDDNSNPMLVVKTLDGKQLVHCYPAVARKVPSSKGAEPGMQPTSRRTG